MILKTSYLVIWQRGRNDLSRDETTIDVKFHDQANAEERMSKIENALAKAIDVDIQTIRDNILILGLFKL